MIRAGRHALLVSAALALGGASCPQTRPTPADAGAAQDAGRAACPPGARPKSADVCAGAFTPWGDPCAVCDGASGCEAADVGVWCVSGGFCAADQLCTLHLGPGSASASSAAPSWRPDAPPRPTPAPAPRWQPDRPPSTCPAGTHPRTKDLCAGQFTAAGLPCAACGGARGCAVQDVKVWCSAGGGCADPACRRR